MPQESSKQVCVWSRSDTKAFYEVYPYREAIRSSLYVMNTSYVSTSLNENGMADISNNDARSLSILAGSSQIFCSAAQTTLSRSGLQKYFFLKS